MNVRMSLTETVRPIEVLNAVARSGGNGRKCSQRGLRRNDWSISGRIYSAESDTWYECVCCELCADPFPAPRHQTRNRVRNLYRNVHNRMDYLGAMAESEWIIGRDFGAYDCYDINPAALQATT